MECPVCRFRKPVSAHPSLSVHHCPACDTAFVWPQPSGEALETYYEEEMSQEYLAKYQKTVEQKAEIFSRYARTRFETGRVLDIGCGYCHFLNVFKSIGWDCDGVDYSPQSESYCRERFGIEIRQGDFMKASMDGPYHCISAQHVMEHMPDPRLFLDKIRRLLAPGGLLFLAVPNYNSLLRRLVDTNWLCLAVEGHLFHYTIGSIRRLAALSGFRVVDSSTLQFDMADVLWAVRKRITRRPADRGVGRTEPPPVRSGRPLWKNVAISGAGVFRPLLNRMGLGSEIIAVLEKRRGIEV